MELKFERAKRKAVPMLISLSGVSGSGKTYSGLLMAAGMAGSRGTVGLLDTENGRGAMYADSPGIVKALPNGYVYSQLTPPYSPERYTEAIKCAENSGISVLVIDSTSHEWEGIGGAQEMAERNKLKGMPNWSLAKMAHKKFVNHILTSPMHIIFCLRAREKVKILETEKGNKKETSIVPLGIQPIAEKNFVFEMLLSLLLDEETHFARPLKVPEPLLPLFTGSRLITKEDGERIRQWNETGDIVTADDLLRKRARSTAEDGMAAYSSFFSSLTPAQKRTLNATDHAENKRIAESVDKQRVIEEFDSAPYPGDFAPGSIIKITGSGRLLRLNDTGESWEPYDATSTDMPRRKSETQHPAEQQTLVGNQQGGPI